MTITFLKKTTGEERTFRATLDPSYLPEPPDTVTKPPRNVNPDSTVIRVYLPDEDAWRSFDTTAVTDYFLNIDTVNPADFNDNIEFELRNPAQ